MNESENTNNLPNYVVVIKRHTGAIIHLINWLVTYTADNVVDIAARALAFSAPMPNALRVYAISQTHLGFGVAGAFAFAMTLELVIFATLEITMIMWDGYLSDKKRYRIPLRIASAVNGVVLFVVIGLVYELERNVIMSLLPVVSAACFVGLALKRWDARVKESVQLNSVQSNKKSVQTTARSVQPPAQNGHMDSVQTGHNAPTIPVVEVPTVHSASGQNGHMYTAQSDQLSSVQSVHPKKQIVHDMYTHQMNNGGKNVAEIARETGMHRSTINKYINEIVADATN